MSKSVRVLLVGIYAYHLPPLKEWLAQQLPDVKVAYTEAETSDAASTLFVAARGMFDLIVVESRTRGSNPSVRNFVRSVRKTGYEHPIVVIGEGHDMWMPLREAGCSLETNLESLPELLRSLIRDAATAVTPVN